MSFLLMNTGKIKIIIAVNIMHIGGAERTVQTIALNLDKNNFDVIVLCLEGGGARVKLLEDSGIKVLIGNGTIEKIKELIPSPQVDILHFHRSGHKENLHIKTVDYLKPKKIMETNVFAFEDDLLGQKFDLRIYKSMMMLTQRAWKGRVSADGWWKKQRVIYNPVTIGDFEKFRLSDDEKNKKRKELGIGEDDIIIGRNGRNDPVKWGDLIIASLPFVRKELPNIKIIFQTAPTSRIAWLKKRGYLNKSVIVLPETGNEKEIAEIYQILDIYIHPSRRGEAFGNSLNEAMVWGLPIIVENTPHWDNGQLEQVIDGKTGYIVKSVGGFMSALKLLAENNKKRRELGDAGRQWVEKMFKKEIGIKQYELSYNFLVGKISEKDYLLNMVPSVDDVIMYAKEYSIMARLDYPHIYSLVKEVNLLYNKIKWRIYDSLAARGIFKV